MRTILILILIVLYMILSIPLLLFELILRAFNKDESERQCQIIIIQLMKLINFISGVKTTVIGEENVPKDEAVLYVPNHRSLFDFTTTVPVFRMPSIYIGKKEFMYFPIFGIWVYLIGTLLIDRKNRRKGLGTIAEAIKKVKEGKNCVIFPEGTRNKGDQEEPLRFREGSLRISSKTGCKVVPVAIIGSRDIYELHKPWVKPGKVKIVFGKPIDPATLSAEELKNYGAYTREKIVELIKANV
ncbi:MAG: lysophospholipid acyltransferase family protein [Eubacteriales bacterium]|nr:lysophospholipid acyltransferase family protein [Eubacteriales bacterium]